MTSNEHHKTFASIKWAIPFLESPDWSVHRRTRGASSEADSDFDRFNRDTIRSYDGVQHRVELYQKPSLGSTLVTRSISLNKFGPGLMGYHTICHGGAVMTMMDEALAFATIANEAETAGIGIAAWSSLAGETAETMVGAERPLEEALKGFLVTAHLDMKFLKPVFCPGVVGIEVTMVENKGHRMRLRGIMKDGEGAPLVKAEGLWVRIGGGAKI